MGVAELEKYLDIDELCEWLKTSKPTIYRWLSEDKIPSIKLGQKRLFDPEEIRAWLHKRPGNTMPQSYQAKVDSRSTKKPAKGKK